ncbi:MAG: sodium:calcium antiporter [Thermanaeromonas sp.]|uniref:sodium:calcium antiporter n=1 Tax=Thermanaeromonas sp. TaxID=2003697 RepID=UPI00243E7D0A|nr:sodium:calcium antiporter [Thermanaeromonas sp.]MCG0277004.1 sodium:calcium antiporter [Thermanaeromonas sp.]
MADIVLLVISLGIILLGAEVFTNGVEWLGKKLNLGEGAVGSILAAVGTALPESMIPVVAILFGGGHVGEEVGIGAILGAPFMLSTLAFFIVGLAVIAYRGRRHDFPRMRINTVIMGRDLAFFLLVYAVAILAALLKTHLWKQIIAIFLAIAYFVYAYLTVTRESGNNEEEELHPLYFARRSEDPALGLVVFQVLVALGLIIGGARIFVRGVEHLSNLLGVPAFVLSLIIAPIATELPEKFNSIIWIGRGKDTLALGNITGAMVFQSSLLPALGITMTSWDLTVGAMISAVLAILSAGAVYLQIRWKKHLTPYTLMGGGAFYLIFVVLVFAGVIR